MAKETDRCPLCGTVNSYQNTTCVSCKEQLPWAAWVQASQGPSQTIGGRFTGEVERQAHHVDVSFTSGPMLRILLIGGALLIAMAIAHFAYNNVTKKVEQSAGVNGVGNVVQNAKKQMERTHNAPQ